MNMLIDFRTSQKSYANFLSSLLFTLSYPNSSKITRGGAVSERGTCYLAVGHNAHYCWSNKPNNSISITKINFLRQRIYCGRKWLNAAWSMSNGGNILFICATNVRSLRETVAQGYRERIRTGRRETEDGKAEEALRDSERERESESKWEKVGRTV